MISPIIRPDSWISPNRLIRQFLRSKYFQKFKIITGEKTGCISGIIPFDGMPKNLIEGRIIIVGDSAGQALPLIGEGIRFCIEAGQRAGLSIVKALLLESSWKQCLSEYENWWNEKYRTRFEFAGEVNEIISKYHDNKWNSIVRYMNGIDREDFAKYLQMEIV